MLDEMGGAGSEKSHDPTVANKTGSRGASMLKLGTLGEMPVYPQNVVGLGCDSGKQQSSCPQRVGNASPEGGCGERERELWVPQDPIHIPILQGAHWKGSQLLLEAEAALIDSSCHVFHGTRRNRDLCFTIYQESS